MEKNETDKKKAILKSLTIFFSKYTNGDDDRVMSEKNKNTHFNSFDEGLRFDNLLPEFRSIYSCI